MCKIETNYHGTLELREEPWTHDANFFFFFWMRSKLFFEDPWCIGANYNIYPSQIYMVKNFNYLPLYFYWLNMHTPEHNSTETSCRSYTRRINTPYYCKKQAPRKCTSQYETKLQSHKWKRNNILTKNSKGCSWSGIYFYRNSRSEIVTQELFLLLGCTPPSKSMVLRPAARTLRKSHENGAEF
jgi:hypothetical protein